MTATVSLDDKLLARAQEISGKEEISEVINEVLKIYSQREAALRLAEMGGTMPDLEYSPQRRSAL